MWRLRRTGEIVVTVLIGDQTIAVARLGRVGVRSFVASAPLHVRPVPGAHQAGLPGEGQTALLHHMLCRQVGLLNFSIKSLCLDSTPAVPAAVKCCARRA